MDNMILIIYGTRPEYIKVKPLIEQLKLDGVKIKTLFTGQHADLVSQNADYNLKFSDATNNRLNSIISNCVSIDDSVFEGITHVLVQGDTTSVLGLALNAFNRGIKIIHLEAGLRTYDYSNPYPEEMNRQLVSRISDINLCPTNFNMYNLVNEKVIGKSYVVGNTGLDNLLKYKENCSYENTILVTLHRRENHDKIKEWFKQINYLAKKYTSYKFVLPIHPNPNVKKHRDILTDINVIEPLKHDELINLLIKCSLVITDSGGLQEECSFFNKKCLVCRETTERPESLNMTSYLIKAPSLLVPMFEEHIKNVVIDFECPYGNGFASKNISKILKTLI